MKEYYHRNWKKMKGRKDRKLQQRTNLAGSVALWLGIFTAIAGIYIWKRDDSTTTFEILILVLSIVAIIVSTVLYFRQHVQKKNTLGDNLVVKKHNPLKAKPKQIKEEELSTITHNKTEILLYDREINKLLEYAENKIILESGKFTLHPDANNYGRNEILNKLGISISTNNEAKLRLRTNLTKEVLHNSSPVFLQKTDYFSGILSNMLANYSFVKNGETIIDLRKEVTDSKGFLKSLVDSTMSDHLGGSCLVITADNKIVFQEHTSGNLESPNKVSPSASGSFDFYKKEILESLTLQQYIRQELTREFKEECQNDNLNKIQICGYGRALHRSGKPDFFAIARTQASFNELYTSADEKCYQSKSKLSRDIKGEINKENTFISLSELKEQIEKKGGNFDNASCYLYWNVVLAIEYLAEHMDEEKEKDFFGD